MLSCFAAVSRIARRIDKHVGSAAANWIPGRRSLGCCRPNTNLLMLATTQFPNTSRPTRAGRTRSLLIGSGSFNRPRNNSSSSSSSRVSVMGTGYHRYLYLSRRLWGRERNRGRGQADNRWIMAISLGLISRAADEEKEVGPMHSVSLPQVL